MFLRQQQLRCLRPSRTPGLQRTGLSRTEKGGHHDIVTEGDIASQRIAMTNLGERNDAARQSTALLLCYEVPRCWQPERRRRGCMPLSPAADTNARYVYECLFELPDAVNDRPLWESSLKQSHTTIFFMFTVSPGGLVRAKGRAFGGNPPPNGNRGWGPFWAILALCVVAGFCAWFPRLSWAPARKKRKTHGLSLRLPCPLATVERRAFERRAEDRVLV